MLRVHIKVSTQASGGALFMTEQPIERRGSGPPRHYHEGIVNVGPPLKL
jgi:hypothetical protein